MSLSAGVLAASQANAADRPAAESSSPKADDGFAPVRALIEKTLIEGDIPSIAVAVVKDGKIIWEEGFGWADRERQVRATVHTAYSLASATKPITATAVMKLHEARKLDIDAPIERYLGDIKLTSHAGSSSEVTARRIMAHSAGLPRYGYFYLDGSPPAGSKATISKFGMTVYPPGTRFEYSNIGMKILDAAIEHVSKRTYADYLRREIFLPLGMKNSAVGIPLRASAAVRYDSKKNPMRFYLTDHPGSGDVWSSAHDMARFLAFHMGTPLRGQREILSRARISEMQRPASASPMPRPPAAPRADIGASWTVTMVGGHPQIFHPGGQPGVSTYIGFYPDQKVGVVVLANSSAPAGRIVKGILDVVAPEVAPREAEGPPPSAEPIPFRGRWSGTVSNYAGTQPLTLDFQENGEIAVQLADQASSKLSKPGFEHGALTGDFEGKSEIPEAQKHPHNLSLKVVSVNGELVGQLTTVAVNENAALMLPSFVRLRHDVR
jgi:CubicO group peptidase (beta-lactamase class C family)